jgi:hypothetical protein
MPDRPSFHETCACGAIYTAGTGIPNEGLLATWRAAHVEHEEPR